MKYLVLAEKPSVGKDIAKALHCQKANKSYIEGAQYVVTWAMGHLVTLADPEKYNEKYKNWDLQDLPIMPEKLSLTVMKETRQQFNTVKDLIQRKDIDEIIIATDAGREGELVARWILLMSGNRKPLKRLWISSVTEKAIKEGFQKLKDGKAYESLFYSASARAEADWLVGINATRALTTKYNAQLSCGRVQTPTLAIVQKREEEIRQFIPRPFYGIQCQIEGIPFTWHNHKGAAHLFEKEACTSLIHELQGLNGTVADVKKTRKTMPSPPLYDLTELQRDANKKYGFSPKETLSLMQTLYERHKALTYPRTDSRYLTRDIVPTLKERLRALPKTYSSFAAPLLKAEIKGNKNFVDDQRVTDHHAIIPTEQAVFWEDLTERERKIYDLVVKRFLSVLYPPHISEETVITVRIGKELFTAKGNIVQEPGFKIISSEREKEDGKLLAVFQQNMNVVPKQMQMTTGATKPPSRFTEASLLSAMENPSAFMENKDQTLSKTLGETGGLGTVATRADIIEKLFSSSVMEKRGQEIFITKKGIQLLSLAPLELKSPKLTAEWELKLGNIVKGNLHKNEFLKEIREYTKKIIQDIKSDETTYKHDNLTANRCPKCGQFMLEIKGKKGRYLVCQDRECGERKNLAIRTNARCPQCHKNLELVESGAEKRYVCSCGYKEKETAFLERKKKERNTLSKKDVNKYLQNQKDDSINNPMKDILSQLKF